MSNDDIFLSKLTAYREAANQGIAGLTAVLCVLRNRVRKNNSSYYVEATKPWQFSSISIASFGDETLGSSNLAPAELEINRLKKKINNGNMFITILSKYPAVNDPVWKSLDAIVKGVLSDVTPDITSGATSYYEKGSTIPKWAVDGSMKQTCQIGQHLFFTDNLILK